MLKDVYCQNDDIINGTTHQSRVPYLLNRARTHGILGTLKRIGQAIKPSKTNAPSVEPKPAAPQRNANAKPNNRSIRVTDLVQIATVPGPAPANGPATKTALPFDESLNLQAGDWVEVKSREEITATLDSNGKCRGLLFMPEQFAFCGKRLRVYKRTERILLENTGELRKMKNTVLLEGSICDGWNGACNRSCFFFWREAWLRKVS